MAEALNRRIGPGLLTAYGVGVMVGAGIYVLIGTIAGQAGIWAPLSFLLAGVVAAPTALSYAEFSTRLPEAAGEAVYVSEGLRLQPLALLVGLAIVAAGTISAGAVLRGGAAYLSHATSIDPQIAIVVLGLSLTVIAILGVLESLAFAAVLTLIEITGLALVVWAGAQGQGSVDWTQPAEIVWSGVALGAVLAFFAFIGFEDIVNLAEEVETPSRTLPRAILLSLVCTSVIYALVAWAAVRTVPLSQLSGSESPLVLVWQTARGEPGTFLSAIAVFAALNGVLAQIVMAARVMFGLGRRARWLSLFHHAHPRFGTPVGATLLLGALVIVAALAVPVAQLAEVTSAILLAVFVLVNLALIAQKRRAPAAPFRVPMAVPVVGCLLALAALVLSLRGLM